MIRTVQTKENVTSVVSSKLPGQDPDDLFPTQLIFLIVLGATVALLVIIAILHRLSIKRDKKRDKLSGLQSGIGGAESCTKDYQELCRARMAGKGNPTDTPTGRIASLSKESDARPPSSRSSTSSWSEEPALTNMDISTGHMVLVRRAPL